MALKPRSSRTRQSDTRPDGKTESPRHGGDERQRRGWPAWLTGWLPPWGELRREWLLLLWALASLPLQCFGYPPFFWWPLGFVAFAPWFVALLRLTPRAAFWVSLALGSAFYYFSFRWVLVIDEFLPYVKRSAPWIDLFHSFWFGVAGMGIAYFYRRLGRWAALGLSLAWWIGWEWFRANGPYGSPVALAGHTVGGFLAIAQTTSLAGMWLLSAMVIGFNLALAECLAMATARRWNAGVARRAAAALATVLLASLWGAWTMQRLDARDAEGLPLRVALLQPNVSQHEKIASYSGTDEANKERLQNQFTEQLMRMLDTIAPGEVDLAVLPETAFTQQFFDMDRRLLARIQAQADRLSAPLVVGAADVVYVAKDDPDTLTDDPRQALLRNDYPVFREYNALFVFRPGEPPPRYVAEYRKIHLLPFGESVPYLDDYPKLRRLVAPEHLLIILTGEADQRPIALESTATEPGTPYAFGPSICYEDKFPYLQNRMARREANLLLNIANNAWFLDSTGIDAMFQGARFRSPETRLPILFCTNSGITAVVDSAGRVTHELPQRTEGILRATVRVPRTPSLTLYARFGDWLGIAGLLVGLGAIIALPLRDRRAARRQD